MKISAPALCALLAYTCSLNQAYAARRICSERFGEWTLVRDEDYAFDREMTQNFRAMNAPVFVDSTTFEFSQRTGEVPSDEAKKEQLRIWQHAATDAMGKQGFTMSSESALAEMGLDRDDVQQHMLQSQPYGKRDQIMERFSDFAYFLNENGSTCTREDRGGFAAVLITSNPRPGEGSHWGSFGLIFYGAGTCGFKVGDTRTFIDSVKNAMSDHYCTVLHGSP